MKAAFIRWLLILVLLAIPVTSALAQSPAPEATPTPAPIATPIPQETGPIRLGFFTLAELAGIATLVGIIVGGLVTALSERVLRPMQRREVELLQRELECVEREKESLANVLREQKAYLEMQLRHAKEKANIPLDATLPPQPVPLDPKDREALQQLLNRLEHIESVSIAAGVETPPPDPWKYVSEGHIHHNLQQYEQAIEKYSKALELKPDFHEALYNRGLVYSHLGRHERAIQDYDKALELKPDFPEALYSRGNTYAHLGQHERAIQDYDKLLELKPDLFDALVNRGCAYDDLGQHDRAIQDYHKALDLKPKHPTPRYNIACAYSLMNKPDEALKWLKEAVDLDEQYRDKAKTDSDFDNIRDDPGFKELVGE